MDRARAIRIAENWSQGHVCTLRDGEAKEYHKLCLAALREQDATDKNDGRKTNADRIRAMTDEELAEWMAECNAYRENAVASQWLPWLKQPAGGADYE